MHIYKYSYDDYVLPTYRLWVKQGEDIRCIEKEKCIRWYVRIVVRKLRSHLNLMEQDLYIAGTVIQSIDQQEEDISSFWMEHNVLKKGF